MMIKICGITNRDDALASESEGASALGFNFYPGSPRYVTPEAVQSILEAIGSKILKVGVFVNAAPAQVETIARTLCLDVVQLHGDVPTLSGDLRVWRAMRVTPGFRVETLEAIAAEAFLLDTPAQDVYGGSGRTFDWRLARGARRPVILAGGLDESNVRLAIEAAHPWGVDACSRLEAAPGRKDPGKLARFLKAALS